MPRVSSSYRYVLATVTGIGLLVAVVTAAEAASCLAVTVPVFPSQDGELPAGAAILLHDQTCGDTGGFSPLISVPVSELDIDVDGEPATLERFPGLDVSFAWQIVPAPPPGARVTITGCDEAAREESDSNCTAAGPDGLPESGPWFSWTFTTVEAATPPELRAPVLSSPVREDYEDFFGASSDDRLYQWTFDVTRGDDDPGHPMLVKVVLAAGVELERTLAFTDPDLESETVRLVGETVGEGCVTAQTFDLQGNEGPSSRAECNRPPLHRGCRLAGDSTPGLTWLFGLGLLAWRRRAISDASI